MKLRLPPALPPKTHTRTQASMQFALKNKNSRNVKRKFAKAHPPLCERAQAK